MKKFTIDDIELAAVCYLFVAIFIYDMFCISYRITDAVLKYFFN